MAMISRLEEAIGCVRGALTIERDEHGVTFHRAPARARARVNDAYFEWASKTPSGVRLDMSTDAHRIALVLDTETVVFAAAEKPSGAIDVVVDGRLLPAIAVDGTVTRFDPIARTSATETSGPCTVTVELGRTDRSRRVEVWFSPSSTLRLIDVRTPDDAIVEPADAGEPVWVHHGSSISQCAEVDRPTSTWPAIVARDAGLSLTNLALAGQCQLDHFMAVAIRDEPADVISLEVGINIVGGDTMRELVFRSVFHAFLDVIRDGHPTTPIVVITPICSPPLEEEPGPARVGGDGRIHAPTRPSDLAEGSLTLRRVRDVVREYVGIRTEEGDQNLFVLDGLTLLGSEDAHLLPDALHPNAEGYRRIATRLLERAPIGILRRKGAGSPS